MALQHSDGFDSHATGSPTLSDGDPGWTSQLAVTIQATGGKFSGKCLRAPTAVTSYAAFSNTGTYPAFAGYFKTGTWPGSGTMNILQSAAAVAYVTVNQAGDVVVKDGAGTTRITALALLPAGVYKWLEVSYRNGSIVLSNDGVTVGTYTGAYTALATTLRLANGGAGLPDLDVDDFLSWDNSGSYFNTYGLTPRRIQTLRPTANGDVNAWAPLGASNWQSVDATSWVGGAGVVSTSNGQEDLYAFEDLVYIPAEINAVVIKTRAVNNGVGVASMQHVARNLADVEALGTSTVVPMTVAPLRSVMYRDPANVAWTGTEVNNAQFGQVSVI